MYLVCSLVKNCQLVGWSSLPCPPILESKGKNAMVPFLPLTSLKDLPCNFLWGYLACWLANGSFRQLLDSAFAVIALGLSLL